MSLAGSFRGTPFMTDVSESKRACHQTVRAQLDLLRPSEYTAVLIQALRANPARVRGARVLEVGSGSGVVLAALGALGAATLCGIDIEGQAVLSGAQLLSGLGYAGKVEFLHGDMWLPVSGRCFDLIVANLPHFPTEAEEFVGRLPNWSRGGRDGRWLLDRFLHGIARHMAPGAQAIITHNAFISMDRSREIVEQHGLSLRTLLTTLLYVHEEKLNRMTASVLHAESGRSIHRFGSYAFAEMHIVAIADSGHVPECHHCAF